MSQAKLMVDGLRIALKEAYEQSWRTSAAMLDNLEAFLIDNERRMAELGRIAGQEAPALPPQQIYAGPEPGDRAAQLKRWEEAIGRPHAPGGNGG